ncbi:MAG: ATP-dependent DNA helicase [bacterium]
MKSNEIFDERYKRLNKAQKEAVDTIDGPVLVIAGPGTGKTTILTLRIANILIKTDTPPSGILAITFTDAGVKSMKEKLREVIGTRADEVKISTFHGFASSIISEFKEHFVHLDGVRQMIDIEAESLIRKILENEKFSDLRPFGNTDFYITHILSGIRDSKKEALTGEMVKDFAKKEIKNIESDEDSISTRGATKGQLKAEAKKRIEKCEKTILFADVYEEYEAKKKELKLMDFDDLIFELLLALGRDETLLRLIQEKFLYILVDEHQDTNDSQNLIIKMLADFFESPNIFIVGDEKQAIYRFQGASVANFLKFQNAWPDVKTIFLEENYRSHQSILDVSFKMIENNYVDNENEHLRVKLVAKGAIEKKPVEVVHINSTKAGEDYVVDFLKKTSKSSPEKTIAIITKNNRDVERMVRICEEESLQVSAERNIPIFSHPIGILFFSLIEFLRDISNTEALGKTIAGGLWDLSFEESVDILKSLKRNNFEYVERSLKTLTKIKRELLSDSPIGFLHHLAIESGLSKIISRDVAYVEVWRGILSLSESIVRDTQGCDIFSLIDKLLAYKISAENKSVKINIGVSDAKIKIMTAHGSKGLEFDYVLIPYATEESWSSRGRGTYFVLPIEEYSEEGDDIRDTRRLFYVALTRAKEHVVIVVPEEDGTGKILTSLRFLDELDQDQMLHTVEESKNENILKTKLVDNKDSRLLDYTKTVLLEKGLSVTALNHFIKCPSEFIYKSILKLPEAPAPSAEKGVAIHRAFDLVWQSADKSEKNIQKIIEDTLYENLDKSFLYNFEKEAVKKEILPEIPKIAKSLHEHFMIKADVSTETWAENIWEGKFGEKKINITLHGKLDAIVETANDVFVYDYKTRGKMSENEIRGNTKNSDGNYFRQLSYYKLLLQNKYKDKSILTSLVFVMPDDKGNCTITTLPVSNEDIEKVKSEVGELVESVWSGKILSDTCGDPKCEWCNLKSLA